MRTATDYNFAVIPLFLLMGAFASTSGMSRELFRAANGFVGHLRGGLGIATIAACGGFAAICGSSVATAATFSTVAYPEMRRYGYPQSFATGVIAAGGTLGIMIPPSTVLAVYGIITEQDIGKLFIAGIVPGILAVAHVYRDHHDHRLVRPGFLPAGAAQFLAASGSRRCATSGRRCCCSSSSSAASMAACSPPTEAGRHGRRRRLHHRRCCGGKLSRDGYSGARCCEATAHHRGGVHHPDRRAALRLFPHHHPDAAEGDRIPHRARARPPTACWR